MGKFMAALLGDGSNSYGRVLSSKMTKELKRDPGNNTALFSNGFWQNRLTDHYSIHHGGVMAGHETELFFFPEKKVGFFIGYNRSSESAPEPAIRYEIMFAFMRYLYSKEMNTLIEKPKMTENADKFTGSYVSTLGCFTCNLGDGWPLDDIPVQQLAPGVLQAFGSEWYAIDSTHFQRKGTKQKLSFHYVPSTKIRYMVFMNTSFIQLNESVLNSIYPNGWKDKPATQIEALMHVSRENWTEATKAFEEMAEADSSNARAFYYAGLYALYSNSPDRAIANCRKGISTGNWVNTFTYYMAAAYAQKGNRSEVLNYLNKAVDGGYVPRTRMLNEQSWWSKFKEDEEIRKFFR